MSSTLATALARLSGLELPGGLTESLTTRVVAASRAFEIPADLGLGDQVPAQR
ncbi:MAG TPA: hypothetical protein PKB06_04610 [Actinotalea sp.]|nr:hypothetical protein [Actinotalea sp.]